MLLIPQIKKFVKVYLQLVATIAISGSTLFVPTSIFAQLSTDGVGRVTGCAGETLADYSGFSVALYEADPIDPTAIAELTQLTTDELPSEEIEPNRDNINPFFLTNTEEGKYNFLLDGSKGQLNEGKKYVLVINPPSNSNYDDRRIRLVIGDRVRESGTTLINYSAQSLDGKPINLSDPLKRDSIAGQIILANNAESIGLNIGVLTLGASICQVQEIRIDKTGDRSAAEPGDTIIYRLAIRNLSVSAIEDVRVGDSLPQGFNFKPESVRGAIDNNPISVETNGSDREVNFKLDRPLESGQVLVIAYAAQLNADSLRGSGKNSAMVEARRSDTGLNLKDGPVNHLLRIESGITADCGTLIGRVFVDKNFDGEQQPGEPGIPNAVIFLQDGNRITTDTQGLFSVANILPGTWTGVLDLTSTPGYTIAPNKYFIERNSQSRLVRLAPGGMVRMNFALTPTSQEEGSK
jgi:uncharacterized repeat protein (TIGR01451 family)